VSNPTDAYLTKVTQHLESLPKAEHVPFLDRQIARWEGLYQAFSRMVDGSDELPAGSPTAFDYRETIDSLGRMRAEYAS
jgi:hypothetical protein